MDCERICSSIFKESDRISLADHLIKDGRPKIRPGSMVMSRCLGLFWVLIRLGFLRGDAGSKPMVPTIPPFFNLGSSFFPGWKNIVLYIYIYIYIFFFATVGNG